ncbi:hypothetical protein [Sphingomicrobium marinum]|uniref:hypothetical protein n=1 Tax=Sphingomicrobium marinum TaxID=1227950 RepID=UPI00223EAA9E|nr:hypothetical protein [Sphingomicrobium marinum]
MSEHKAFASLSSGLLARKGDARPAMRRQSFGEMGQGLDDLGWNDMGEETPAPGEESADTAPRPGFVQGRYDDGDDNDKGVLAALGPLAGLSAAKAVQDHIQSESQQANSVREQQADIMKHFAVSDDEAWCDGEDYIDETAEEWDPEAEDAGGNAFNEHKGIAKDYSAHKDMADLDPMQLAEPTEAPAGFVPFAAQEDEPEAVEDTPVVDEAPADISEGPPVQDMADEAFDAAADEVTQVDTFEEDEEAAFAAETEEVVAETHDDVTVDEGDEEPAAHESTLYDLEFVGDIAEDEDAVAEHGAIIDQPVDEADDKVPFDLPEAAEIEAVEDVSGAEEEPLELTDTVEEEEDALELTDAIEAEDDALELTDAIEDEKDEDTLAAQADEEDELVLDAPADAKTEMVDPFANADESVDDVAITPAAEPAVEISKVVPLSAPVRPRRPRAAAGSKEKAAFTLRLDKERHLKLRLASALTGQSSQKLLVEALDRMLADMPELDTISNKEVG